MILLFCFIRILIALDIPSLIYTIFIFLLMITCLSDPFPCISLFYHSITVVVFQANWTHLIGFSLRRFQTVHLFQLFLLTVYTSHSIATIKGYESIFNGPILEEVCQNYAYALLILISPLQLFLVQVRESNCVLQVMKVPHSSSYYFFHQLTYSRRLLR